MNTSTMLAVEYMALSTLNLCRGLRDFTKANPDYDSSAPEYMALKGQIMMAAQLQTSLCHTVINMDPSYDKPIEEMFVPYNDELDQLIEEIKNENA